MDALQLHRTLWFLGVGMAVNLIASVWAYAAHLRGRNTLGPYFWALVTLGQAIVLIQVALGVSLILGGLRPKSWLHYLYGGLTFLAMMAQYGLRPGGAVRVMVSKGRGLREPLVLALLCLFLVGLLARAYTTGRVGR
ncbi:MAG: hypothetical protein HY660_11375 [Armatimonadetes bacterium]|nr:hypothetical protein [Armatimonadota bacterium]